MRKCCVVGCNATNKTHRLFNFPKNDKLRELWLSFLIPVNAMLSGLSKDQLISRYVCQKHFDRYQFDGTGNRLQHGYPSLFTSMEILHGVPLRSTADNDLSDHNYAKQPTVSQNPTDFTSKVKNNAVMPCAAASSSQTTSIVEIVSNKLTFKIENNPAALTPCAAASISQTTSIVEIVSNEPISNVDGEPTGKLKEWNSWIKHNV
ncbi:uncharacterized protein LOC111355632 isoform X1 [Spodoptera litura]|uniref:Uncharacterized protein LOC111355632 isoform X1 n=1 Tax=Spodoptera litura TaxID=69820 RepID=A0A9J7EB13_SPOLT|nr:uncharacterized protein LOC111355632 isoform X1 [Spodoptera litura]